MLVFQAFADKKKREEEEGRSEGERRFGMKIRKLQQFLAAYLDGAPIPADAAEVKEAFAAAEKFFSKEGLADELSTLTPGAQNAIKAGSFLWGYENAAKYLKNAMKLTEQKGISGIEEKSREVLGSVQNQASSQNERLRESEKIIWTFYNSALKDFQAQASSTEIMVEKLISGRETQQVPLSAKEAFASALEQKSVYPALLYCTNLLEIQRELEEEHQKQAAEMKKEELERLVGAQQEILAIPQEQKKDLRLAQEELRKKEAEPVTIPDTRQRNEEKLPVSQPELSLALKRHEELLREYEQAEKALEKTMEQLEAVRGNDSERIRAILDSYLPPAISQLLAGKKELVKRSALIKQLKKWLAFSRKGRTELAAMPLGRIAKLLSLSSLLKK